MKFRYACIIISTFPCWAAEFRDELSSVSLIEKSDSTEHVQKGCTMRTTNKVKALSYIFRAALFTSGALQFARAFQEGSAHDIDSLMVANCVNNILLSIAGLTMGNWLVKHADEKRQTLNESEEVTSVEIQDQLECNEAVQRIGIDIVALSWRMTTGAVASIFPYSPAASLIDGIGGAVTLSIPVTCWARDYVSRKTSFLVASRNSTSLKRTSESSHNELP